MFMLNCLVMSDSFVTPHGLRFARLLSPLGFSCGETAVGKEPSEVGPLRGNILPLSL